ncbi:hypothetical protein HYX15_01040 [Candidatus Woesearchaeota archaeon]|nr:hypothetical protein [Candidatus Woesearchaeota archaeon]
MEKGEFHWETVAKLIIMVIVIVIVVYLAIIFKDQMSNILLKLKENF